MASALKRGLFHIGGVLTIAITALFLPRMALLVSLGLISLASLAVEFLRFRIAAINRAFQSVFRPLLREYEASRLTGASYIFIASFLAFLIFEKDIAVLAICFLAVGDAVAALVGKYMGGTKIIGKSLQGDIACFLSCLAAGFVFYYAGLNISPIMVLFGATAAAIVQSMPLPVNDNITIPLFSGLLMTLIAL